MTTQKSFLSAIKWSYTGVWVERGLVAIFTVILAALLGPRDFGIVSIAWIFVSFIQMFLDQGLVAALIQKKDLKAEHLDAVFWMDILLSLLLVAASIFLSRWWAAINHAPQIAIVISVLSLSIPIESLSIVQKSLLSRNMDFKSLTVRSNVSVLTGGAVGIGMAFGGMGVWSLVAQQITKDLVALVLLWKLSHWRPRFTFSWAHFRELMNFSLANFAAQLGIFADTQSGSVLLGLFIGPVAVGLYRLADRVMNSVVAASTSSIQMVSLPEFSRFQDQPAELRKSALTCIRLSSTVTLPALAGLAAISYPLMATLGEKWIPAVGVLRILCILGMVITLAYFTGPLLQALSRPHQLAILEWARTIIGVAFLVVVGFLVRNDALTYQIMGIAVARLVPVVFIVTPVFLYILMRLTGIRARDLISTLLPSIVTSLSTVCAVFLIHSLKVISSARSGVTLTVEILFGIAVTLPVMLYLDPHLRSAVLRMTNWSRFSAASLRKL